MLRKLCTGRCSNTDKTIYLLINCVLSSTYESIRKYLQDTRLFLITYVLIKKLRIDLTSEFILRNHRTYVQYNKMLRRD